MKAQIKLGRIFGIEIGLHYSWVIIALLITLSLAQHFRMNNPRWGDAVIWTSAIVTGLLFFAAIVVHELSHALVARTRNLPVRSITLFALGGVAMIEKEAVDAKTEFWMGIAGPITSFLIGLLCLALAWVLGWNPEVIAQTPPVAILMWLGVINIALAVFNMVPGFPLDGGRVLRAIIWWITGNAIRATAIAARVGQIVAFGFIILGIFRFFSGAGFGGLWLAFIGWFLLDAARASYAQLMLTETLRGLRAKNVMTTDCPKIDGLTNLQTFVDEHLLRSGSRCFVVEEQGRIVGIITPHEVKDIERAKWPYTTVDNVMRPLDQIHTISPEMEVNEVLERMTREDVNQLPVVRDGKLEGVISRGHILRLLQTRAELQA
ncbi:MAG TPA: site-2 protease family protein [Pyrinomonadaceae bacterium]|nr:site-2 protease family protein [Pyrinomonadaceae bacterium]